MKKIVVFIIIIVCTILLCIAINNNSKSDVEIIENTLKEDTEEKISNENSNNNAEKNDSSLENNIEEKHFIDGEEVVGYIYIEKINVKDHIFKQMTFETLQMSACLAYGNINEAGVTTIMGQNFKGNVFENLHKLEIGDEVAIATSNEDVIYEIYDIQILKPTDAEYMTRDTNGKREISLSTQHDDGRIVLFGKEKEI